MAIRELDAPSVAGAPTPEDLLRALDGPSILHAKGRDGTRTRAVVTLIHGNEPSGVRALHAWLRRGEPPAVNVLFFVASVGAALAPPGFALRSSPGARDLNRCFHPPYEGPEGRIAREALEHLRAARPECLIDLHNNTGHNPPYGVGHSVTLESLALTALFGGWYVHSDLRLGALVEATHEDFPSATIECGRAGDPAADAVALRGLERFLAAETLDLASGPARPVRVLADPVRVSVRRGLRVRFGEGPQPDADLTVAADVDRHNFERLPPGVAIGWVAAPDGVPLEARGADGRDCGEGFFEVRDGVVRTRRELIPIMMTTDPSVAVSDCLFYAVRAVRSPEAGHANA